MNKPIKQNVLKVFGRDPRTMDELAQCVIAVIESQQNRDHWYNPKRATRGKPREVANHRVVGFAWDIRHGDVSNSHSAPEGYPQNWGAKEGLPTSYPGWSGRVWIRYAKYPYSFGSSPFEKTLTHTGTGGAGSYDGLWRSICSAHYNRYGHVKSKDQYPEPQCYSWDYRIFDADWPALTEQLEKERVWNRLADRPDRNLRHEFSWTDPETLVEDSAFIAECALYHARKVPA